MNQASLRFEIHFQMQGKERENTMLYQKEPSEIFDDHFLSPNEANCFSLHSEISRYEGTIFTINRMVSKI